MIWAKSGCVLAFGVAAVAVIVWCRIGIRHRLFPATIAAIKCAEVDIAGALCVVALLAIHMSL